MTATIYQMPPRAGAKTEERAMSEETGRDRYDGMTRIEIDGECEARGWGEGRHAKMIDGRRWYNLDTGALREALRLHDRDPYALMSRAELRSECRGRGIHWGSDAGELREALQEYDRNVLPLYQEQMAAAERAAEVEAETAARRERVAGVLDDAIRALSNMLLAYARDDYHEVLQDTLARPALTRKACELALDLLSDHT